MEDVWEVSDESLLAGYATGDREAALVFVRRFEARAYGLALAITRDRAHAEEVAQDALVRAWRYASSYDPRRGSVAGWLLGIVRNVALDHLRVANRRAEIPVGDAPPALPRESAPDASDAIETRDTVARVAGALASLPDEQREALVAVTVGGRTANEVSTALAIPLGTVKTRVRLALRKLRAELSECTR